MNDSKLKKKINRFLSSQKYNSVTSKVENGIVYLSGKTTNWESYLSLGLHIGKMKRAIGVVNNVDYKGKKQEKKPPKERIDAQINADVVIIGAGVIGCNIARELSRFKLNIVLVEKESDVACGASKANNAMVHTGIGEPMKTFKQQLCVQGHQLFPKLCQEINVPFKQNGMIILLTPDSFAQTKLPAILSCFAAKYIVPFWILRRAKKLKLPMYKLSLSKLKEMEPNISAKTYAAIYAPNYGITSTYLFTIALAENSVQNGVKLLLNTEVIKIHVEKNQVSQVVTNKGTIKTKFVINAAGLYADKIAAMAGTQEYTIHPKKGATIIFDKNLDTLTNHSLTVLTFPRTAHYKGGGLMKTVDGNLQWGPTISEIRNPDDTTVSHNELQQLFQQMKRISTKISKDNIITYFAGLRACTFTEEFYIKPSQKIQGFIHVAGIQSPGLAASPAIAQYVLNLLKENGLQLTEKSSFNAYRKKNPHLSQLPQDKQNKIIAQNPRYGHIVCRCEHISEGEIIDAIHSTIPVATIDAIKRRTRAGMGRCQGGFCTPYVAEIISRETNTPLESVTKNNDKSTLFIGKAKSLLREKHEC